MMTPYTDYSETGKLCTSVSILSNIFARNILFFFAQSIWIRIFYGAVEIKYKYSLF